MEISIDSDKRFKDNIVNDIFYLFKESELLNGTDPRDTKRKRKTKSMNLESQINKMIDTQVPLKERILKLEIPIEKKALIMKKYYRLKNLDETSTEYFKQKEWIDCVLDIPWNKYMDVSVSRDKASEFILNLKNGLDSVAYGLTKTKEQILTFYSKRITNPKSKGAVLGLQGNPGIGKSHLVTSLSEILGVPYKMIALGGAKDVHHYKGHGFTYEGAIPGRIVQILIETQCLDPIIYLDEPDKISDSGYAAINGFLIHLIDPTTNYEFQDNYFSGISVDLSRVLFIFSFNDINKIDSILLDRMKVVQVEDPSLDDKIQISKRHLIPKSMKDIGFNTTDIKFTDDTIEYIIKKTKQEKGVRQLKRNIETILERINVLSLLDKEEVRKHLSFGKNITINFPFEISKEVIDKLFEEFETPDTILNSMYI